MTDNDGILVADIGGTNARFAMAYGRTNIELDQVRIFSTTDYDSLQSAVSAYLDGATGQRPSYASFAIAGPVIGDHIKMTNCPWSFHRSELPRQLNIENVSVLNDFEAISCVLPFLPDEKLLKLGPGQVEEGKNKIVLGPGTGIGVSALIKVGDGWKVITSEAGHVGFAPTDELERQILKTVKYKYPRVSVERVISGRGFTILHQALSIIRGAKVENLTPMEITRRAIERPDGNCGQVVDLFCSMFGTFAGDMAVTFNATGGVYLAGGILPKIQEFFIKSDFRERFEDKGRLEFVKEIPTFQILEELPALIGAAAYVHGHFYK